MKPACHIAGGSRPALCACRGFTLVELVTVLVILAILAAIAMPSMSRVMATQRVRAGTTDLMSSLLVARSEAIKRNQQVSLVPNVEGDWASGWRVAAVATDEQIDERAALGYGVAVTRAPATIVYQRNGRLTAIGTVQAQIGDSTGDSAIVPRCLIIDPSGLPHADTGACS